MKYLIVFCFLVSGPALAQSAGPAGSQPKAEYCDRWYPSSAPAGLQTVTTLTAKIEADGSVSPIAVSKSSGRDDLDSAAMACAPYLNVGPATKDGKPIEIVWQIQIRWNAFENHSFIMPSSQSGDPNICHGNYPVLAVRLNEQGRTSLSFHIMPDGAVQKVSVVQSSGYDDLDQASINCVLPWRYAIATRDGKPVEFEWKTSMTWALR